MEIIGMYPTFYVPYIGTAWVMGTIGVIHVLASHTSVGASFLFALLETKAYRDNQPQLMDFIKRFGVFPAGLFLHHRLDYRAGHLVRDNGHEPARRQRIDPQFRLGMGGRVGLFHRRGDRRLCPRLSHRQDRREIASQTDLVVRARVLVDDAAHRRILSFMMWPGNKSWFQTGSTNDAFYNLNFFAHLGVRTGSMFVMAAVVGLIVAGSMKDRELKRDVIRLITPVGLGGGFFAIINVSLLPSDRSGKRADHAQIQSVAAICDRHDRRRRRNDGLSDIRMGQAAICAKLDRHSRFLVHRHRRRMAGENACARACASRSSRGNISTATKS